MAISEVGDRPREHSISIGFGEMELNAKPNRLGTYVWMDGQG